MASSRINGYDLSGVRRANENSYLATMQALQGSSSDYTKPYVAKAFGEDDAVAAYKSGAGAAAKGVNWTSSFAEGMNQNLMDTTSRGFSNFGDAASFMAKQEADKQIYKATKSAMEQQQAQQIVGSVIGLATAFI